VALFIDRARRARPDYHPVNGDYPVIDEICDLVAGLPLGIELAASGMKNHSLRELRDHIATDVAFLRSDEPGQPDRQRSLTAVFNAFWDQLSTEERLLLARLSVFQGVVTQEAARKVADASAFFLGGLVSRGLLQRALPGGFRSHSMHRRYLYDRLKENTEEFRSVHFRHRDYYLSFLRQLEHEIRDNPQMNLLDDIEFEIHNIRAALAFSIKEKDEQTALEFCELLMPFWKIRGYYQEGYHWLKQTFDLNTNANQVLKASSLTAAAKLVSVLGDYAEAEQFSLHSLSIAREIGDQHLIARALNSLGAVASASGDTGQAQSYFGQSLDIYKNLRVEQAIAGTQVNLAVVNINNGKLEEARETLNKALVTFRNVGDSIGIIQVLHNQARIDLLRGNHAGARELLQEALERSWGLNARNELATVYLLLAELHILKGEDQAGLHLLSLIDQLMKGYSIAFPPHDQKVYEDSRSQLRKKLPPETFTRYWQEGCETSEPDIVMKYIKTAV
jgi:tetratricopeptide (TPR) repeat protein